LQENKPFKIKRWWFVWFDGSRDLKENHANWLRLFKPDAAILGDAPTLYSPSDLRRSVQVICGDIPIVVSGIIRNASGQDSLRTGIRSSHTVNAADANSIAMPLISVCSALFDCSNLQPLINTDVEQWISLERRKEEKYLQSIPRSLHS